MVKNINLYKVNMPLNMAEILGPVLQSGFITEGPQTKKFEEEMQKWVGNPNLAIVNSGTSALTLAMKLCGVGPGSEVISSPMTCLATNSPVHNLGGKIVWCDVDTNTGNIDPNGIEKLITDKTKAILFVDWAGTPAELDSINAIAHKYGIKTIEDGAHALGSFYKGRKAGTSCDYTMFSFQAIKHLTTVDGGALACSTKEDYDKVVLLRWFGLKRGHNVGSPVCWSGDVPEVGFKMHMNDVNATIGLEQMKHVDRIISAHRKNGFALMEMLKDVPNVETCAIPDYIQPSFWFFTIKLKNAAHRKQVNEGLANYGIASNISHTRNDEYSAFDYAKTYLPNLDIFADKMLNIPCGWWVSDEDLSYIVDSLKLVS